MQFDFFADVMGRSAYQLVEYFRENEGKTLDLFDAFHRVTFDIIGHAGYGHNFDAVTGAAPPV